MLVPTASVDGAHDSMPGAGAGAHQLACVFGRIMGNPRLHLVGARTPPGLSASWLQVVASPSQECPVVRGQRDGGPQLAGKSGTMHAHHEGRAVSRQPDLFRQPAIRSGLDVYEFDDGRC